MSTRSSADSSDRPRRADVARLGALSAAAYRQGGMPGDPREQGLQTATSSLPSCPSYSDVTAFFAPTMVTRLDQRAVARLGRPLEFAHHRLWRRADVCRGLPARARRAGAQCLVQIYGQGESPMTITGLSRAAHLDRDHARYMERLASVGIARTDVEVRVCDGDDAGCGRPARSARCWCAATW